MYIWWILSRALHSDKVLICLPGISLVLALCVDLQCWFGHMVLGSFDSNVGDNIRHWGEVCDRHRYVGWSLCPSRIISCMILASCLMLYSFVLMFPNAVFYLQSRFGVGRHLVFMVRGEKLHFVNLCKPGPFTITL